MTTAMSSKPRSSFVPVLHQRGFTLIEMMISVTIGLAILAGLVGVLATNASNARSNDRTSELMTNGRYALNSIKQEVREAGFRGHTWAEPTAPGNTYWSTLSNGSGCFGTEAGATADAFIANVRQGVWGSNNANPFAANCIPAASYSAGNDVMVVRRMAVVPTAETALQANTVYFRSIYERGQLYRSTAGAPVVPPFTGATQTPSTFELRTYVYYISPFTVSANENPLVPSLRRMSLQTGPVNGGTMVDELVASGIEHLQVRYSRLTTAPDTQYLDTLTGGSSTAADTDWDEVNSVRLWLLARNATPEPGYANTSTYVMGDQSYTVADSFRRQLFTTVVQLRN
jgi:type IV pilus assembly protein PilW